MQGLTIQFNSIIKIVVYLVKQKSFPSALTMKRFGFPSFDRHNIILSWCAVIHFSEMESLEGGGKRWSSLRNLATTISTHRDRLDDRLKEIYAELYQRTLNNS